MKIERRCKAQFEKEPLDEWLESPMRRKAKAPVNIIKKRDNLLSFSKLHIKISRILTWAEQTTEVEQESATGLRYASKMYAAFLKLAEQPEQELTFKIYDLPEVTWNGKGMLEAGYMAPDEWFEAYFLAVITRDKESMESLAKFPVDIMKQSATKAGPVSYKLVEVFQAFHHRQKNYPALLNECMKMAVEQGNDWALDIAMGYLETFAALTTDIGFDFNETLAKNLQLQEKYWIKVADPGAFPVKSFIPLQLLGMACMWHDKGNKVTVESDSLPRFLIEGTHL